MLGTGCGDEPVAREPAARETFDVRLQSATCTDWKQASPGERRSAVDQLENAVAGPRKEGNTLPDGLAYSTLDARCGAHLARGFLLYELYTRAAGFESLSE